MSLDSKVQAPNSGVWGSGTWPKINGDWNLEDERDRELIYMITELIYR